MLDMMGWSDEPQRETIVPIEVGDILRDGDSDFVVLSISENKKKIHLTGGYHISTKNLVIGIMDGSVEVIPKEKEKVFTLTHKFL